MAGYHGNPLLDKELDLPYVIKAVSLLSAKWPNIHTCLRIMHTRDDISRTHPRIPKHCLIMLDKWLNYAYDMERDHSLSTWRKVVWFVKEVTGGSNAAQAMYIENNIAELSTFKPDVMARMANASPLLYLRGVDVVNQTSLAYSGKACSFHSEKHGFTIYFPDNALPPGTSECYITVTASISGQYQFPKDCELVSGVYWITCPVRFTQPVTLEIQHCSSQTKPDEDHLSFVTAQENLPYRFRSLGGGIFPPTTSYGSVQLTHFSGFGITGKRKKTSMNYCAQFYYTGSGLSWEVDFVIVCNTPLHHTVVRNEYTNHHRGTDLTVQFEKSGSITLDVDENGITTKGWKICPLNPTTITKEEVDSYEQGRRIPSCRLHAQWIENEGQPGGTVIHRFKLKGTKDPSAQGFIAITLPPGPGNQQPPLSPYQLAGANAVEMCDGPHGGGYVPPQQQVHPLPNEVKICDLLKDSGFHPSSWQSLAARLGISDPDSVKLQKPNDFLRLRETICQWRQNDIQASWEKLADEVSRIEGYGAATKQTILKNAAK